ncbi:hypothetical protein QYF61_000023 [Mycteria americana]|uniref:Uncharacterized protein n=1 Tax=Mycteria americana TaxID=33587 RepID=A0AAN7NGF8_MYCAM|nr:hypothetical protein QYF61_000023 [Mycteria americana]
MLAGPDPLVILYVPCDSTQDDLLHQLPRHRAPHLQVFEIPPGMVTQPLPLAQLEAISSRPITCCLGEETDPHLSTTSFQTLHQLHCPSLDTLQHLNVFLVVGGPKLNTVFECRVQGHNHFLSPAGHTISDTSQDAIGFLGHLGTLLAHIQAAVNQHFSARQLSSHSSPSLWPCPLIQPVQVLLQSLPTLKQINTPAQLGVICKLTEGALDPFVQIIDKDVKQNWPQHRALGNTACGQPATGVNSTHHHSLGLALLASFLPSEEYACPCHDILDLTKKLQ